MSDHPDEHVDGCLCDCDHAEHEATEDHNLPAAVGGVQGDRKPRRRKATRTALEAE